MEVKLSTLSENSAIGEYCAEWGLSVLVEVGGSRILLDTGLGHSTVYNAQLMRIDLPGIDKIALSHAHADHTGGLRDVLRRSGSKEVVAHPDIWQQKYARREGFRERFIGVPFAREALEALGASFTLSREPVRFSEHITTTGEIPMTTEYETIEPALYVKEGDDYRPDTLADDLALIIDAGFGLVVVLGCAHRGIINTLRHAIKLTGNSNIYCVIGGAHLLNASLERLALTAAALREMGVQKLGLSHCTGFAACAYLANEFGADFFLNNAGTRLSLPL
jgi:7,8-dihydropterin-6-yl-methyl-4-(beta-D-ribofuranosyl)aminobenzene 5'-phosphate synthase